MPPMLIFSFARKPSYENLSPSSVTIRDVAVVVMRVVKNMATGVAYVLRT